MAHTPGPWTYRTSAYNGAFEINGADSKVFVVADIYGYVQWPERAEANARLIAAAPETAAERDRLRAEVAELVQALGGLYLTALKAIVHDHRVMDRTRAVLAKHQTGAKEQG